MTLVSYRLFPLSPHLHPHPRALRCFCATQLHLASDQIAAAWPCLFLSLECAQAAVSLTFMLRYQHVVHFVRSFARSLSREHCSFALTLTHSFTHPQTSLIRSLTLSTHSPLSIHSLTSSHHHTSRLVTSRHHLTSHSLSVCATHSFHQRKAEAKASLFDDEDDSDEGGAAPAKSAPAEKKVRWGYDHIISV